MKILTVVGARPQFIKLSPICAALDKTGCEHIVVHTGQHYDYGMSEVFFNELGITEPDINLLVGSGSHAQQTAEMLIGIEKAIIDTSPDWVLLYGDTNSTIAGALAAVKLHVKIAHVEAGLRSFNKQMPEEINRIVTDAVSDMLFVPTADGVRNLRNEGIPEEKIQLAGDVMYDAVLIHGQRAEEKSNILAEHNLKKGTYVLATIHRAENTDDPVRLANILEAFGKLSNDIKVILPLHPRTKSVIRKQKSFDQILKNIEFIDPVGYLDMIMLEKNAALIATDSGGVQKEAFFQSVPCVTLRDETEWVELVELGWNHICSPKSADVIVNTIRNAIGSKGRDEKPYGDGNASALIVKTLMTVV